MRGPVSSPVQTWWSSASRSPIRLPMDRRCSGRRRRPWRRAPGSVDVLALAARLRRDFDAPLVLMGYLNPVLAFGEERFFQACAESGVDGVILPDLPSEEGRHCEPMPGGRRRHRAPARADLPRWTRGGGARASGGGFAYYVSVTGVTGARAELPEELTGRLSHLRARADSRWRSASASPRPSRSTPDPARRRGRGRLGDRRAHVVRRRRSRACVRARAGVRTEAGLGGHLRRMPGRSGAFRHKPRVGSCARWCPD